jgi:FAD/FMN-containing dehydrogenase
MNLRELETQLKGRVTFPGDDDYDRARTVFQGGIDRRPAAVVRVADAADVARVVAHARDHDLELAVRGGAHSAAGHAVTEGGVVIDLGDMRALAIDPRERTAWAETGLTAGGYTVAAAAHGLATGFGDTGSVGIGGITLGGGVGFLVRKHGLTIDNLLAAELVTAAGVIIRVDAQSHPDLFWAIRGGGGNFGVATKLKFRLHELDGIVGGMLFLPATAEVISGFVAAAEEAPEELSAIANVMPAPPLPFLPAGLHGRPVVMASLAYAGATEAGIQAMAPFRGLAEPLADMLRPMSYPEVFLPEQEDFHPIAAMRTTFADGLDVRAAETMLERIRESTAQMAVVQLRVLGGAVARVPADATAFAHRDRRVMVNVVAAYQRPEEAPVHRAWAADLANALDRGRAGAYVNFIGDEGPARVREAYPPATWARLRLVKAEYDPANVFRLNQNISPAALARAREHGPGREHLGVVPRQDSQTRVA